jgi:cell division protease FtsH
MKFSPSAVVALGASTLLYERACAFTVTVLRTRAVQALKIRSHSTLRMALDGPPMTPDVATVADVPVLQSRNGAPVDVRYSDFLKLVNADRLEKVTFNADGTKLLGVDTDGVRLKIEALPNDPDLLTQLTAHKVSLPVNRILLGVLLW